MLTKNEKAQFQEVKQLKLQEMRTSVRDSLAKGLVRPLKAKKR